MELVPSRDQCLRAMAIRDARFDGRFFVGVRTTGVYCRPVCPARTPKQENITFFSCAAAAEEAGFRPCRRCRPESAPGTPAWQGAAAAVGRALKLIEAGALDADRLDELAARVGVGERHLRRLFSEHVGASPAAVAATCRAHRARRLLDQTDLPMGRIAEAAGFASVRRFNAALRATFGRSPTELRRRRARPRAGAGALVVRLGYRPPLDWTSLANFLAERAIPGVEEVTGGVYRRTVCFDDAHGRHAGTIEVRPARRGDALEVTVDLDPLRLLAVGDRVRRLFDLDADPLRIGEQLRADPLLAGVLARRPGLRIPGAWDGFELAVRAILGQQVTVRGASTLAGRLVAAHGEPAPGAGALSHLFPEPARLAAADLASLGMPRRRAAAISALAAAVADGSLRLDGSADAAATRARLLAIPGLGPWTVDYIALRALGEPDAFPAGDLGLRRALSPASPIGARAVADRAEPWRPWRGYAALLLWSTLAEVSP